MFWHFFSLCKISYFKSPKIYHRPENTLMFNFFIDVMSTGLELKSFSGRMDYRCSLCVIANDHFVCTVFPPNGSKMQGWVSFRRNCVWFWKFTSFLWLRASVVHFWNVYICGLGFTWLRRWADSFFSFSFSEVAGPGILFARIARIRLWGVRWRFRVSRSSQQTPRVCLHWPRLVITVAHRGQGKRLAKYVPFHPEFEKFGFISSFSTRDLLFPLERSPLTGTRRYGDFICFVDNLL